MKCCGAKALFLFADSLLVSSSLLLVVVIVLYSGFVLCDVFCTNNAAFASNDVDLLRYRKQITDHEKIFDSSSYRGGNDDLRTLNPDIVGWININDTNIDYPIVQGDDDLEYAAKNFKGEGAVYGSIYLSAENSSDFGDVYNIIFGHHMKSGAMFGDIEKYADESFFRSHIRGTIQTVDNDYELHIFACVLTDAYDSRIYGTLYDEDDLGELLEYVTATAAVIDEDYVISRSIKKITVLSTCADTMTNGRAVLFADTFPTEMGAVGSQINSGKNDLLAAVGRILPCGGKHWAFINLLCVILTALVLLPLFRINVKYSQRSYAKSVIKEIDVYTKAMDISDTDETESMNKLRKSLKNFRFRMISGTLAEIILAVLAAVIFILTENVTMPLVMSDEHTLKMILILAAAIVTDVGCFRFFRGIPEALTESLTETLTETLTSFAQ